MNFKIILKGNRVMKSEKVIMKCGSLAAWKPGKLISLEVDKFSFSTHQLINLSTNWLKGLRVESFNRKSGSLEV